MSCKEWKEHLIARLYRELDPEEDERLSRHLATCAACVLELGELTRTGEFFRASAGDVPSAPRVVLLAARSSRLPFLAFAASLAGVGLLSGLAVAWAWQARGTAEGLARSVPAVGQTDPRTHGMSREEMEKWLEARLEGLRDERGARREPERLARPPERPLTKPEVEALLARMERKLDRGRAADVQYLLGEMAAVEARTGLQLGETQQAIKYLALASDPRISEQ